MPWKPIARKCKQKSTGKTGSHVVVKVKDDGGTEQESCHTSKDKAQAAIRARYANESDIKENKVKITKRQLLKIINEEKQKLLEYEQYVDEDGNVYDDEGNVSRRGAAFGRRYGGGTYGLRGLPPGGGRSYSRRRKTGFVGAAANTEKIEAIKAALEAKPNNFLQSIHDQLVKGRSLSDKQKSIVRKILMKHDSDAAALFEGTVSRAQIRKAITKVLN